MFLIHHHYQQPPPPPIPWMQKFTAEAPRGWFSIWSNGTHPFVGYAQGTWLFASLNWGEVVFTGVRFWWYCWWVPGDQVVGWDFFHWQYLQVQWNGWVPWWSWILDVPETLKQVGPLISLIWIWRLARKFPKSFGYMILIFILLPSSNSPKLTAKKMKKMSRASKETKTCLKCVFLFWNSNLMYKEWKYTSVFVVTVRVN